MSQSAFMRGFIDDATPGCLGTAFVRLSQSAFMRGFIDDYSDIFRLRPMNVSQSAFMRGFIDDTRPPAAS